MSTPVPATRTALRIIGIPQKFRARFTNQPTHSSAPLAETVVELGVDLCGARLFEVDAFGSAQDVTEYLPSPTEQISLVMSWTQALALAEKLHALVMKRSQ